MSSSTCISSKDEQRTSVVTDCGVEVFDTESILEEYAKEFEQQLSHRKIDDYLRSYEQTTQKLLEICLESAKQRQLADWTVQEVAVVFRSFANGSSPGLDMFPPEIFKRCGNRLLQAITNILNSIKNTQQIPRSWIDVLIVTFYKNKGSRKMLKYYRGIFLTSILSKIMEKLIKSRVKDVLETINPLQCGGRCNRSTCDCTFILRSVIDHAKYLNRTLYLTLYDYRTCFDSLWLEDCIISLWNLGIRNQMLPLIYKMNESSKVVIKSPYGPTRPFNCPRIAKQGTVLGSTLCGSTTAELCNELNHGGASILTESVKGLLFVDDTITANNTFNDTIQSNQKVVLFSKRKRVEFNVPKCVLLIINYNSKTPRPILFIDEEEIANTESTRYLGDIYSESGTNKELIDDRVKKGKSTTISIMAMCTNITLGLYRIRVSLLLYEVVFLAAVLFNSQAWSNITKAQFNQLETSQLRFLKRTMQVPSSTPNAFTFLELGVLPIRYKIHKRQLIFLHHIVHLPSLGFSLWQVLVGGGAAKI